MRLPFSISLCKLNAPCLAVWKSPNDPPPLPRPYSNPLRQPSYGDDYVPQLRKAALDKGLTFVGPELAAEVAEGNMEAFTKLVEATREALEEDE